MSAQQTANNGSRRTNGGRRKPRKPRVAKVAPKCASCGRTFATQAGVVSHTMMVHSLPGTVRDSNKLSYPPLRSNAMSSVITNEVRAKASMQGVKLSTTRAGYEWAMRAMHPMDETRGGGIAIPDDTVDYSAIMELRHSGVLSKPAGITEDTWDCQVLCPPLPDMPIVYRTKGSGTTAWSRWIQFSPSVGAQQTGRFQVGWVETVGEGSVAHFPAPIKAPTLLENGTQFRQSFRGLTVVHNSSALTNMGMFTGGQWGGEFKKLKLKPFDNDTRFPSAQIELMDELEFLLLTDVPDGPDALVNKVPSCERWEAREGAYFPLWFNNPTHLFNAGEGEGWTDNSDGDQPRQVSTVGCPVVLAPVRATDNDDFNWIANTVWLENGHDGPGFTAMTTAGSVNQHVACGFFMGIDKTANLMFTARSGEEVDPNADSPIAPFALRSPIADPSAIQAVQAIQRQMQMVYPAKYNSLGLLAPLLAKAARFILPIALPWLNQKLMASVQAGVPSV